MKQLLERILLLCVYCATINHLMLFESSLALKTGNNQNNISISDDRSDEKINNNDNNDNEIVDESGSGFDDDYEDDYYDEDVDIGANNETIVTSSPVVVVDSDNNSLSEDINNDLLTKDFSFDEFSMRKVTNKIYDNMSESLRNKFAQLYFETLGSLKLSAMCHNSTVRLLEGIYRREMWAIKFVDAFGGWPSGLADGVLYSFGEYDECLNIQSNSKQSEETLFSGQYCLAKPTIPQFAFANGNSEYLDSFNFSQNEAITKLVADFKAKTKAIKIMSAYSGSEFSPFQVGVCVPSTCDARDIEEAINKIVQPVLRIPIKVGPHCSVKSDKNVVTNYQLTAISCLSFFCSLVIVSTVIEIFYTRWSSNERRNNNNNSNKNDKSWESYVFSFSAISNTRNLYASRDRLHCVDTLLLIFVIWLCLTQYLQTPLTTNFVGVKSALHSVAMRTLDATKYFWVRIPFIVDSVFLISGVIIAYDFFGRKHETHIIRLLFVCYPKFVIEKWLRFAVRALGPIFVIYMVSAFGDGPVWPMGYQFLVEPCQTRYHHNLLFYNNYAPNVTNSCNRASLYLSIIFQLQVISPLFLIPLLISPVAGVVFNTLMICLSSIICVLPRIVVNHTKIVPYEVSRIQSIDEIRYSYQRYHFYIDQYLIAFIIGIIGGYYIRNEIKHKLLFINRLFVRIILWFVALLLICSAIIWTEYIENVVDDHNINIVLWLPLAKLMWCLPIVWFIYVLCTHSSIGSLNRLLSARCLKPIARLSLGFLLYNSIVVYFRAFNAKHNYEITNTYLLQFIYIDFTVTLGLTYAMYILLECPINNWISLVMSRKRYTKANSHYNAVIQCNNDDNHMKMKRRCNSVEPRKSAHKNIFKRDDSVEIKFMFPGD